MLEWNDFIFIKGWNNSWFYTKPNWSEDDEPNWTRFSVYERYILFFSIFNLLNPSVKLQKIAASKASDDAISQNICSWGMMEYRCAPRKFPAFLENLICFIVFFHPGENRSVLYKIVIWKINVYILFNCKIWCVLSFP